MFFFDFCYYQTDFQHKINIVHKTNFYSYEHEKKKRFILAQFDSTDVEEHYNRIRSFKIQTIKRSPNI